MTTFKSEFLRTLNDRGYIHQCTDDARLDQKLAEGSPCAGYIGFDCTADSLHVGSLVPIMLLRLFQKSGHRPIIVMGGGTTKVGDPSGKDQSRQILSEQQINHNMLSIKTIFEKFITFGDGPTDAILVNNDDWLSDLSYIPFLRNYGIYFSVNRMISFESVKVRLDREQPLSFLEFNYMILQAYDFLELFRRYGCILQMGGSDQWGNIVNGIELGRRTDAANLFGLTSPLITTASGAKMGKTADGAVWLNESRLSPYNYYQFWRNTDDKDVGKFLRLFTELPIEDIKNLESNDGAGINDAKKALAYQATLLCHGKEAAERAQETSSATFEKGLFSDNLPTITVDYQTLEKGAPAFSFLVTAGIAQSNGQARKLIRGGGIRLNDIVITNEFQNIGTKDTDSGGAIKLSVGRKRHLLIRANKI
jgi:tyrosyl-tRNA synthetase